MKPFKLILSLVTVFLIFSITSCKKNKNIAPIDQLSPETQTGKNTFGCLVDGKVFLPKGPSLNPILQCAYQYLQTNYSKGYFFQLGASQRGNKELELLSVSLGTDSLQISSGQSYKLKEGKGNAGAQVSKYSGYTMEFFLTTNSTEGELFITKLDEINQIVSGTFWFNAVNENGDTVKVTDGRFDMQYYK